MPWGFDGNPAGFRPRFNRRSQPRPFISDFTLFTSVDRLKAGWWRTHRRRPSCLSIGEHGFVRADAHVYAHYITVLMLACMYPALLSDNSRVGVAQAAYAHAWVW